MVANGPATTVVRSSTRTPWSTGAKQTKIALSSGPRVRMHSWHTHSCVPRSHSCERQPSLFPRCYRLNKDDCQRFTGQKDRKAAPPGHSRDLRVRAAAHLHPLGRGAARGPRAARSAAQPGRAPAPVWTWSLTEGMRRDGEPGRGELQRPSRRARFHRRPSTARPSSTSRIFTSRCANPRRSGAACATSTSSCLDRRQVRRHHFAGPVHSGGDRAQRDVSRAAAARSGRAGRSSCANEDARQRERAKTLLQPARATRCRA